MKLLITFAFMLFSFAAFSQKADGIKFNKSKHSFGTLTQNKPASFTFSFTNNTGKPLVVETATAECGCTTPEYPKAPVAKGKKGNINVTYNAAALGAFTKKVTVKFLGIADPVILTIDGDVKAAG